MDGRGIKDLHKCGEEMSKNSSIPSQEQQENKWAEWLGRGERKGDKGPKVFCPGWRHQPGQNGGLLSRLVVPTGTKGYAGLLSRLVYPGQKAHVPPAGPASRWTRDKSHLLSRAPRLPGQMAWNKCLFCSSEYITDRMRCCRLHKSSHLWKNNESNNIYMITFFLQNTDRMRCCRLHESSHLWKNNESNNIYMLTFFLQNTYRCKRLHTCIHTHPVDTRHNSAPMSTSKRLIKPRCQYVRVRHIPLK